MLPPGYEAWSGKTPAEMRVFAAQAQQKLAALEAERAAAAAELKSDPAVQLAGEREVLAAATEEAALLAAKSELLLRSDSCCELCRRVLPPLELNALRERAEEALQLAFDRERAVQARLKKLEHEQLLRSEAAQRVAALDARIEKGREVLGVAEGAAK